MSRPLHTTLLVTLLTVPPLVLSGCTAEKTSAPAGASSSSSGTGAGDMKSQANNTTSKASPSTTSKPSPKDGAGPAGKKDGASTKPMSDKAKEAAKNVQKGSPDAGAGKTGTTPGKQPDVQQHDKVDQPETGSADAGKAAMADAAKVAAAKAPAAASYKVTSKDRKNAKMSWFVCATCHGQKGKGDGPAGQALKPKPRTFADGKWQKSVTDKHLFKVIKEGGASVGLSPLMAPNSHLPDGTIHALVEMVRKMGPKK